MAQGFDPTIPAFHAQVASDVMRANLRALFTNNSGLTPPGSADEGATWLNENNFTVYQYIDGSWRPMYRFNPTTGFMEFIGIPYILSSPSAAGVKFVPLERAVTLTAQVTVIPNVIPASSFIHSIQTTVTAIDPSVNFIDVGDQQGQQKYVAHLAATLNSQIGMYQQIAPFATSLTQDLIITLDGIPTALGLNFVIITEVEVLQS